MTQVISVEDLCWVHSRADCQECQIRKTEMTQMIKSTQPISQPRRRARIWRNAKGGVQWEMTYEAEEGLEDWIKHVLEQKGALELALREDNDESSAI